MVFRKDILPVGSTQKTYGIKGEIVFRFRKPEYADAETEFYFLDIDGIPVPFFIEEFTYATDVIARVKLEGLDNEESAARYVNTEVYLPRELLSQIEEQAGDDWDYFIGFTVVDQAGDELGVIEGVDDSTLNTLFLVKKEGQEYLIPATEDFIETVDEENNRLIMHLPSGLIEK